MRLRQRWVGFVAQAALIAFMAMPAAHAAQRAAATASVTGSRAPSPAGLFASDVSSDPSTSGGEPVVAVNPTDPRNVIVTYTQTSLGQDVGTGYVPNERNLEGETQCGFAVSHDGGVTWERRQVPITDVVQIGCADPFPVFGPHGEAHLVAGVFGLAVATGEIRIISSTDGGSTWGSPVVVGHTLPGPGSSPDYVAVFSDRPWIAVDQSTGTVYASVVYHAGEVGQNSNVGNTRYVTSSSDGGATWGPLLPVGSAADPGGDAPISAADGTLAVAYVASSSPASSGGPVVLSLDRAGAFTRIHTPFSGSDPQVAADPSRPGTYSVLVLDPATNLEIYATHDYGRTWSGPVIVNRTKGSNFKAWVGYSPTGVLGVVWRTTTANGGYDVFAADRAPGAGGFTVPAKIRTSDPPAFFYAAGDDFSDVTLTGRWLYVGWGNWSGGRMDAWWGGYRI